MGVYGSGSLLLHALVAGPDSYVLNPRPNSAKLVPERALRCPASDKPADQVTRFVTPIVMSMIPLILDWIAILAILIGPCSPAHRLGLIKLQGVWFEASRMVGCGKC